MTRDIFHATAAIFFGGMLTICVGAQAHEATLGQLTIKHPWSRATPKSAPTGAGYMTIVNSGTLDDRLIAAESEVAQRAEFHRMTTEDGIMRMRPASGGITIPAGGQIALEPGGGYHIMLVNLKAPLNAGTRVPLVLRFEKAGSVTVELAVEAMGARKAPPADHDAHKQP